MSRTIQVFLRGQETAEISDELVSFEIKDNMVVIKTVVDEHGTVWTHYIPFSNLGYFRVLPESEEIE